MKQSCLFAQRMQAVVNFSLHGAMHSLHPAYIGEGAGQSTNMKKFNYKIII